MKNIIIFGAGGHSKVIVDIIEKLEKYNIVGIVDKYKCKGELFFDYKIIGIEEEIDMLMNDYNIQCGVIGVGDNSIRKKVFETVSRKYPRFNFETLIHPKSNIGIGVKLGDGSVVMSGVSINANTTIGNHCIINTNSSVDHDCNLGNYVSLAPNSAVGGNVNIGNYSFLGMGSNVLHNITIGKNNVIGASSLVVKDIGDFVLGYGVPFKKVRKVNLNEKYL
tara:strand:- start:775 stop:1437 length:663 start_codon:yes stop_codon:yes gene_type:complete